MTIERQKELNVRYKELTKLAKWNVCRKCGSNLEVVWNKYPTEWKLRCHNCNCRRNKSQIKARPTRTEETKARLAKMEISQATENQYNIDELFKE